jgi:hypothetical protein
MLYHNLCAGILEQSKGTKNQVGIKLSYRPARLHRLAGYRSLEWIHGLIKRLQFRAQATYCRLAESIPWNNFLGSLKV